jgi:hypothetical protein
MILSSPRAGRRGAIAPIAAVVFLFLFICAAFVVDLSWVVLTRAELQSGADAAALAAVNRLSDRFVAYHLASQSPGRQETLLASALAEARAAAKECAKYNGAGDLHSLTLRDEDIEFGITDEKNVYTTLATTSGYPNTVKVQLRRDKLANQPLPLYFARALGRGQTDVSASAAATLYAGDLDSFSLGPNDAATVLPLAFDVNHWNNFLATGKDADGKIALDKNGDTQLQVYAVGKDKGNFGLVSLNNSHTGANDLVNWIEDGLSSHDLNRLSDAKLLPLSEHPKDLWDWLGSTGLKASVVMAVNKSYADGNTYLMPLFLPKNSDPKNYQAGVGQGANYNYNIVALVGVRLVETKDINNELIVQPAAVTIPSAIFVAGSLKPAQAPTSGAPPTTFASPKLTQ